MASYKIYEAIWIDDVVYVEDDNVNIVMKSKPEEDPVTYVGRFDSLGIDSKGRFMNLDCSIQFNRDLEQVYVKDIDTISKV